jgi:hypothetical protein
MRGFLDSNFPNTPTSYISVLDRLTVGSKAAKAYSFGNTLKQVPVSTKNFETDSFYDENNTRLQDALTQIAKDSKSDSTHVIITDGRRTGAASADQQYSDMRQAASDWIAHGGTFVVGMTLAPFKTVSGDPSGCQQGGEAGPQTCPLYAFAFVGCGDRHVLNALSDVFEHTFAWPAPTIPGSLLVLEVVPGASPVTLNPSWARTQTGTPIARSSAPVQTNMPRAARVTLSGPTTDPLTLTYDKAIRGEAFKTQLALRPLISQPTPFAWAPVDPNTSVVRVSQDTLSLSFHSYGEKGPRSLIRLDMVPTGEPSWLGLVNASDANDEVHTYGIGRLFEAFRVAAKNDSKPMARLFFVVN